MVTSYISLFIAIVLINHIAVQRLAAADELGDKTLTHAPLCSSLLTGITLIISMALLTEFSVYSQVVPILRALKDFVYLIVLAFVAQLLCAICFKLKPISAITTLFPVVYINSIGLGLIVPKIHTTLVPVFIATLIAVVFIIVTTVFYYGDLCFREIKASKKLSVTFLMASIFTLLLSAIITFY